MAAMAGIGAGLAVSGSIMQMSAARSAMDARANSLDSDAQGLASEATIIQQDADLQERQYVRKTRLVKGRAIANAAASGVQITSGTPLMLELDNLRQAAIGQFDIRRSGRLAVASRMMAAQFKLTEAKYVRAGKTGVIMQRGLQAGSILAAYGASGAWKGEGFGAAKDAPGVNNFTGEDPTTGIWRNVD